ncbi:MAG: DEAD/DEAH box helicase family protein [Gomphosphaeria aponina SAG 52.96 = DSM 107014]|uniref:DEAD/DEAH box helicase family protein n=1 Tax=Gomphosphaeria aponina SAG 52.96 = DSM 107014 TaxID=1521640 RepID=A0A941GTB3_9CHRO|nr:DEAD/DEAH box helicase family protein [Gomphosphaeria aponina SAG 52.96 = DSM 107014]
MTEETESITRKNRINKALTALGWIIIDYADDLNTSKLSNHAVEEYPVATGNADYALFVNGLLLGVIEAKRITISSQAALEQAKRYSKGAFNGIGNFRGYRVPFLFSSHGELVYFLDVRAESNLTHLLSNFYSPSALLELLKRDYNSSYQWLKSHSIEAENTRLRSYQIEAIASIENAIMSGKRELLLAMATGTGKTFTIVSSIYRLLASKTVKRVLFLVDRKALAAQAVTAFSSFETPTGNKFNQEYEIYSQAFKREESGGEDKFNSQILPNSYLTNPSDNHTFVYVCTIQRMKINLLEKAAIEKENNGDLEEEMEGEKLDIPIHAFDLIVADECHRGYTASEVGSWRRVIEYFAAIKIGLTATPAIHTVSLFKNIVFRYTTFQAITEGYLVDYEQVNIDSDVRIKGTFLRQGDVVGAIERETGAKYYEQLEDAREFNSTDIESKITVPDSNRKIIAEVAKYAAQHEAETGHFPKMLIFASNDLAHVSHADQLVTICKEIFAKGDDFVQKITGKVDRPLQKIRDLRNRPQPAIAVTVDLLTTGVDIPAIEFLVFMRPVKSRILWVQMLGRGTRRCDDINKTHFKIFDCFGGSLVSYFANSTDFKIDPPRQQSMSIAQVIGNFVDEIDREHHLEILIRRFHRIERNISDEGKKQLELYLPDSKTKGLTNSFLDKLETEPEEAIALLQDAEFQEFLVNYPREKPKFLLAEGIEDKVSSKGVIEGKKPEAYLDSFYAFLRENSEEISAIQILRQRRQNWSANALEELRNKLTKNKFTEPNLQRAYQLVHNKALVDIISLIRFAEHNSPEQVYTAHERVDKAIASVTQGKNFTSEQLKWLGYIREHLIQNLSIEMEDFEYAPIFERHGGKGKANKVFKGELETLIQDLNGAIAT